MARRSSTGYTLIELLLVLTLLSGAGFVLLVKLPVQQNERNLALASTQLTQELRDTRQAALSERTWYEVEFFYTQGFYRIIREGKRVKDVYLPKGVIIVNAPTDIRFYAPGYPSMGGTISLKAGKLTRNVIMMPVTARVREEIVK
ncbi:hypothetical protein [Desulfitobacterium metallireducens]|nr:hypothetical protein [Desulfitobacterium metallireducens]